MLFNKLLVKLLLDFEVPKFELHLKEIKKTEGLNTAWNPYERPYLRISFTGMHVFHLLKIMNFIGIFFLITKTCFKMPWPFYNSRLIYWGQIYTYALHKVIQNVLYARLHEFFLLNIYKHTLKSVL